MKFRQRLLLGLPLISFGLLLMLQAIIVVPTYAMSNKYWDDSSGACDISYCGQQVIKQVSGETRFVKHMGTNVKAYFTSGGLNTVTIYKGNFCPNASSNFDTIQSGDYYSSHASELSNGQQVTMFTSVSGGFPGTPVYGKYYSGNQNECDVPINITVNPVRDDTITGRPLWVSEISVINLLTAPPEKSGAVNYFDMAITGQDIYKIAQSAQFGNGWDGTMEKINDASDSGDLNFTDYKVRFGTPCTVTKSETVNMLSYDLDNDINDPSGAQKYRSIWMSLEVWDKTGKSSYYNDVWKHKPAGNSVDSPINYTITTEPGFRYEWIIHDVYENNVIQISPPKGYDGIFWENMPDDPLCLPNNSTTWANTKTNGQDNTISTTKTDPITFDHYADVNYLTGANGSVDWEVWSSTNNQPYAKAPRNAIGTEIVDKAQVDNSDALVNTYKWSPPAKSTGIYCERLLLKNAKATDKVVIIQPNPSNARCVFYDTTGGNPPGGGGGGLIPRTVEFMAQGGGATVKDEPEVSVATNIDSLYAGVGTKPATNELGYVEVASKLIPNKVNENALTSPDPMSRNARQSPVPRSMGANPNYVYAAFVSAGVCPSGYEYEPVTIVCRKVSSYSCNTGWYNSGPTDSTCYQDYTIYDWYCTDPGDHTVAWGQESTNVKCLVNVDYSPCVDASHSGTEWKAAAGACPNTWLCKYAGALPMVDKSMTPLCEYRCNNGTGARAIWSIPQNDTTGKYNLQNGRDINCYQPWQVSVSCQITYTADGGKWFRANGAIVPAGTVQSWVETITTDSWGNVASYCKNPTGGYLATRYVYGAIGTEACAVLSIGAVSGFTNEAPALGSPLSPNNRPAINKLYQWSRAITGSPSSKCWRSIGRPYAQFNNTDVSTMGCGIGGSGDVKMWKIDNYGSSVEYALYAGGSIVDSIITNYNNGSQGLIFASDGTKNSTGTNFGKRAGGTCDYYASLDNPANSSFVTSHVIHISGAVNLTQALVNSYMPTNGSYVIFADDININSNIDLSFKLSNDANNLNDTGIKVLYLVTKNAINVSPGVTNVDASLISNGTINTCNGSANSCENNLTINGGLAAAKVLLKRTGLSSLNCNRSDSGTVCAPYNRPAEVINYGAYYEMFTAPFKPTGE